MDFLFVFWKRESFFKSEIHLPKQAILVYSKKD